MNIRLVCFINLIPNCKAFCISLIHYAVVLIPVTMFAILHVAKFTGRVLDVSSSLLQVILFLHKIHSAIFAN